MGLEWDAAAYEAVSGPQTGWGASFLERYLGRHDLRGDEAVVDAGCGTGRVTELLLRHLPRGTVLAVDASEAMAEASKRRFAGDPRVRVEHRDVLELQVEEPVDVVFSTATFHWIPDHERLFGHLVGLIKPGGMLAAQCGGTGNIARTLAVTEGVMGEERYRDAFACWEEGWNFAGAEETKARLEAAGFDEVDVWLHEELAEFGSASELARFLKTAVLKRHLAVLPEGERDEFATTIAGRLAQSGASAVDYVRLNMIATRAGAA